MTEHRPGPDDADAHRGLDTEAVATWLAHVDPDAVAGPLEASLITGGKSNLTYLVTDGTHEYVVRRPPLGHVLATAHDMAREHRVMAALEPTEVPVPRMVALCEDLDVIGAPFYVMQRVRGETYNRSAQLAAIGPERTRAIGERLVDTLVTLHAVDYEAAGLGQFGRPQGYMGRQLARWSKQLEASRSRELPGMDELVASLSTRVPDSGDHAIVHGDYRLDNVLVDDADQVVAVLDWEMSTLGDPLADLAILLAYQRLAEMHPEAAAVVTDASSAPGYPTTEEIVARYAAGSGRDVGDIGFHLSFAFFKLAVILEGIHLRHSQGQTVGSGFDGIGDMIVPLIAAGRDAAR